MLLSAVMMLRHLGLVQDADRIHSAVMKTMSGEQVRPGGPFEGVLLFSRSGCV